MAEGPAAGLELVEALEASGELATPAARHARGPAPPLGRPEEAAAYHEALELAATDAERRYLSRRLSEVTNRP